MLESPPIITIDGAIHYANELSRYLQSMRVTELYTPAGKELSVSDLTVSTLQLRNVLLRQKIPPRIPKQRLAVFSSSKLLKVLFPGPGPQ